MRIQVELVRTDFSFDIGLVGEQKFEIGFEEGLLQKGKTYEGEYTVTPRTVSQTLPTRNRLLSQDITVLEIPYHEVENIERGTTAIIGGI